MELQDLRPTPPIPELLATASSLRIDVLAAQTKAEFDARGIDAILLKGPSFARWLYEGGPARLYTDVDFLVSPHDWEAAREMLIELGYEAEFTHFEHPQMGTVTSEGWMRGDDHIDLHCTLWGMGADPALVWDVLERTAEPMAIGGRSCPCCRGPHGRCTSHCMPLSTATRRSRPRGTSSGRSRCCPRRCGARSRARARLDALPEFATGLAPGAGRLEVAGASASSSSPRLTPSCGQLRPRWHPGLSTSRVRPA